MDREGSGGPFHAAQRRLSMKDNVQEASQDLMRCSGKSNGVARTMKILIGLLILALPSFAADQTPAADSATYAYPIRDPYLATVIGTPPDDQAKVPSDIRLKFGKVQRFPERKVPSIFWGGNSLSYSLARQKHAAPLAFVIAGTGGSYLDSKVIFLMRALYGAGYHAVGISSSVSSLFITAASQSEIPGLPAEDAKDIYAVMEAIRSDLKNQIDVTGWSVVGYSLGATQAAFVAKIDSQAQSFNFEHVYLINPSVNLYTSVAIIDDIYRQGLPEGDESINTLVSSSLNKAIHYVHSSGRSPLGSEFLYRAIASMKPSQVDLEGAIGTVFRLSSANMSFTSDVMSQSGKIVKPGTKITIGTNLDPYFNSSLQWSFLRYFRELLLPFWEEQTHLEREALIEQAGLPHIQDFLSASKNIRLVTNADDLILGPGDLEFLKNTFGKRAMVYPWGGALRKYRIYGEHRIHAADNEAPIRRGRVVITRGLALLLAICVLATPCSSWAKDPAPVVTNPLEKWDPIGPVNRYVYRFNGGFDHWVMLPILRGYRFIFPKPVRKAALNFFSNFDEITVLANCLIQLEPRKSAGTLARFIVNSTVGIAGLWDPASRIGLTGYDEDFGLTLGHYGAGAGPYIVIPLLGPSSLRDGTGLVADRMMLWGVEAAILGDLTIVLSAVFPVEVIVERDGTAFMYGELGPFEYELVRYLYLEYRSALIND